MYSDCRVIYIRDALVKLGYNVEMSLDEVHLDFVSIMLEGKELTRHDTLQSSRN